LVARALALALEGKNGSLARCHAQESHFLQGNHPPATPLLSLNCAKPPLAISSACRHTDLYAKDEAAFFRDFAGAFSKLLELGVKVPEGTPYM
jgi:hypothetical protein